MRNLRTSHTPGFALLMTFTVLLLAIYRMGSGLASVAAKERTRGVQAYLPGDCDPREAGDDRRIVLQVLGKGEIKINQTSFSLQGMGDAMKAIYASRAEKVLYVVGGDDAEYGAVVSALTRVRRADAEILLLMVDGRKPNAVWNACLSSRDVQHGISN